MNQDADTVNPYGLRLLLHGPNVNDCTDLGLYFPDTVNVPATGSYPSNGDGTLQFLLFLQALIA